ncbi:Transient receptor putative cation channel sub M member 7 [Desmophyllum pertusum]|uniref:Transient receptor putative cation channel sub M member 7 n=1 Tax=Desmophyllum pertusum TaxID=174260 RepID=A0A9W9YR39_9CNID|nr:Transient receptor putative cation channel sub M member 7 [Desmophyllum pertusum]
MASNGHGKEGVGQYVQSSPMHVLDAAAVVVWTKDHQPEATRVIPGSDVTWDVTRHTMEEPTNAYGELEFTGAGQTSRAKFIRISHDTDPEKVLRLLREDWKLDLPKLLISVTGGAKNFVLHPKLKHVLRQGLLKVILKTN